MSGNVCGVKERTEFSLSLWSGPMRLDGLVEVNFSDRLIRH